MKKVLQITALSALFITFVQAENTLTPQEQADLQRRQNRTHEVKSAYLQDKIEHGARVETAEFRFVLKLLEIKNNTTTHEAYKNELIFNKMVTYLEKRKDNLSQALTFVLKALSLSIEELAQRVGTKDQLGTMQRFVDQNQQNEPYQFDGNTF